MAYFLKSKKLKLASGASPEVILHEKDASAFGVHAGDSILLRWDGREVYAIADLTHNEVAPGHVGLFQEIWKKYPVENKGEIIEVAIVGRAPSIQAISKKLLGKHLSYDETLSIIQDIVHGRIGSVEITYFVASSFVRPPTDEELHHLTRAIAETGQQLSFPKGTVVVDKHTVG